MTLDNILEEIKDAESIVILTHENPDGDAVGSSLAMYSALKQLGKENVDVIIPNFPKTYKFLPNVDIVKKEGKNDSYDVAISLDCATIKMLNGWSNYFESANTKIVIDHHATNTMYGDLNFVNPDSPACCQILLTVFEHFGVTISNEIGKSIITGIITDTGGFQYKTTRPETFEFAAKLLKTGINISEIYKKAMNTKSIENFELRKLAIDRMEFLEDGKISFTYINLGDIENIGASDDDHEGIVDEGRNIEGVEVSIFLRETQNKGYKISLRSNEYVNVSDVALIFGGGGHLRAAGAYISGTPEQIKSKLVSQIKNQL